MLPPVSSGRGPAKDPGRDVRWPLSDQQRDVSDAALPPHVVVDTAVGRLLLPASDQVMTRLISRDHLWEPAESAALMTLVGRGMNVLDIGAHVGYVALPGGPSETTSETSHG
jgi:hypothetical protein